jgi:hypothetical protein
MKVRAKYVITLAPYITATLSAQTVNLVKQTIRNQVKKLYIFS